MQSVEAQKAELTAGLAERKAKRTAAEREVDAIKLERQQQREEMRDAIRAESHNRQLAEQEVRLLTEHVAEADGKGLALRSQYATFDSEARTLQVKIARLHSQLGTPLPASKTHSVEMRTASRLPEPANSSSATSSNGNSSIAPAPPTASPPALPSASSSASSSPKSSQSAAAPPPSPPPPSAVAVAPRALPRVVYGEPMDVVVLEDEAEGFGMTISDDCAPAQRKPQLSCKKA